MDRIRRGLRNLVSGSVFSNDSSVQSPLPTGSHDNARRTSRPAVAPNLPTPVGNRPSRTFATHSAFITGAADSPARLCHQRVMQWVAQAAPTTNEAQSREVTCEQVLRNCASQETTLHLKYAELSSPINCLSAMTWLRELTINRAQMTVLPSLPQTLTHLDVSFNRLTKLSPLPPFRLPTIFLFTLESSVNFLGVRSLIAIR